MASSFGREWDLMGANIWWISFYKYQNLTEYCFKNIFHQKSLLKAQTHCQQHKSSLHHSLINYILKFVEVNWSMENKNLRNIKASANTNKEMQHMDVMYQNGWKWLTSHSCWNIKYFKCKPKILESIILHVKTFQEQKTQLILFCNEGLPLSSQSQ
jgi:hypothetical protein